MKNTDIENAEADEGVFGFWRSFQAAGLDSIIAGKHRRLKR